jgi:hypothetical protein
MVIILALNGALAALVFALVGCVIALTHRLPPPAPHSDGSGVIDAHGVRTTSSTAL